MRKKVMTFVIYDITDTKVRTKMAEACLDKGLERIQFSAFRGPLTQTQRKELTKKLEFLLGKGAGRVFVVPICEEDWEKAFSKEQGDKHQLAPHNPSDETILRF
jgi:CRISPR-associated protein Cas2